MEQTHLISVCVFCLLCATHIHCSEYSSRAVKSRFKPKGESLTLDRFERGPGLSGIPAVPQQSPVRGNEFEMTETREQFLNSTQRSPHPVNIFFYHRKGGANETGQFDVPAGKGEMIRSVLNDSVSSRNGTRSVNKYIKIPESEPRDVRTLGGVTREKREAPSAFDEQVYVEILFKKYRNSENRIDLNGFKMLLSHLGLSRVAMADRGRDGHINSLELRDGDHSENGRPEDGNHTARHNECISPAGFFATALGDSLANSTVSHGEKRPGQEDAPSGNDLYLSKAGLHKLCPFLMYQMVEPQTCLMAHHSHEEVMDENHHLLVWLYATASVIIVSLCGLLGVFVIPIMGHSFYQQLLQFLVALAVGTLCGDALLHLLPHAMVPHNDDSHDGEPHDHDHTSTMWKGLAVLLGIVFFFFTEKCLTLASEWRKKHQRNKKVQGHSHVQILNGNSVSDSVGEKLCKHKYSSYPYCYADIKNNKDGHEHSRRHTSDSSNRNSVDERESRNVHVSKWHNDAKDAGENQRLTHTPEAEQRDEDKQSAIDEDALSTTGDKLHENEVSCGRKDGEYTVIIREHESIHHGHSHAHGHVHSPPESLSSVAWMVILGDGLHNFTDGMAIGAAFANNIAGGFSTAVAVFCHELPHELGDFAVLIKAGMSAKQAVFYNLISSILCFFGMCLGIFVGDNPQATSWVFAVSAGMFLYIGLVDMFPELTSSHSAKESSFCQCSLQGLGLIAGVSIMLIIAFYEDQLLTLFN
ncbi:UNVERIFIED_CONTAM: hypothetical protein PYX00_010292 [Menopon gallinae]|uniref:Solute carrier family 39 member 10 n=1 Tax=Menopon gallinae TaxID=328185 RepID=A0AAW2HF16_9NEOP